jgi:3-phosphoshikimate 1-carboxyvinyltransferase
VAFYFARMDVRRLQPLRHRLDATVRLPGSKSLSIRALAAAALADGASRIVGLLEADDTQFMCEALRALGFDISADQNGDTLVRGAGGFIPQVEADLYGGNSGATVRFCIALAALGYGDYRIDGSARMRQRPVGELVEALSTLGVRIGYEGESGYPPVVVRAQGLSGGEVRVGGAPSSQIVSALLLAAPGARGDVLIEVDAHLPSRPYVAMTLAVMCAFGVEVLHTSGFSPPPFAKGREGWGTHPVQMTRFVVPAPQRYRATNYTVEPDASSASYFLAAPAIAGGRVTVEGVGTSSVQGDVRFVDVLAQMGCRVQRDASALTVEGPAQRLRGVDVDLGDMPDVVPTLAVTACFAEGPTTIRNIAHLRFKETDRLAALGAELRQLGADVDVYPDGLTIHPPAHPRAARIDVHDDHRLAMSFALAGLAVDGVEIENPACVSKSFPGFWEAWEQMQA